MLIPFDEWLKKEVLKPVKPRPRRPPPSEAFQAQSAFAIG